MRNARGTTIQPIRAALTHRVVAPRQPSQGTPPGLLILHGRGADEGDLLGLAGALDPRLLIVAARAPFPLGLGYHWYDLLDLGEPELATFARSRELLERFIGEMVDGYGVDADRLYLAGFSQGAMMSATMTLSQPSRIAGTALLSGYLPLQTRIETDPAALRGKPFFVAHGTQDPVIPVEASRMVKAYLAELGANVTYQEYPIGHQISEQELGEVATWLTGQLDAS